MKELLFHKRKLGYTQSTKRSPLEFQPEWVQGKAWIWSGCGDADVKRGSVLGRKRLCRFSRDPMRVKSASGYSFSKRAKTSRPCPKTGPAAFRSLPWLGALGGTYPWTGPMVNRYPDG